MDSGMMVDRAVEAPRCEGPRLFLDSLVPGKNPDVVWSILALLTVVAGVATARLGGHKQIALSAPFLALGVLLVPIAARFGLRVLLGWRQTVEHALIEKEDEFRAFWSARLLEVTRRKPFAAAGVAVVGVALVSFYFGDYFTGLAPAETTVLATMVAVAAFFAGVGLYSVFFVAETVRRLGRFTLRVEPHKFGILSIGSGLAKCYLVAASIWVIIALSGSLPRGASWAPVVFVGPPSLAVIVGSFVWCQFPLHLRMVEYKRSRLYALDERLHGLEALLLAGGGEHEGSLQFVRDQRAAVETLPEWPFRWKTMLGVVVSGLGPFTVPALQALLSGLFASR